MDDISSDINFEEIEEALYDFIEKASRINRKSDLKTKKELRKEKRLNQKLERIWTQREARKFWTKEMRLMECDKSMYKFRTPHDITFC